MSLCVSELKLSNNTPPMINGNIALINWDLIMSDSNTSTTAPVVAPTAPVAQPTIGSTFKSFLRTIANVIGAADDAALVGRTAIQATGKLVDVAYDNADAYRQQSLVESAISLEHTKQRLTATLASDTSMDDAAKDAIAEQLAKLLS